VSPGSAAGGRPGGPPGSGLGIAAEASPGPRLSRRRRSRSATRLQLNGLGWFGTADELAHRADVNEPPGPVFLVHGIFVLLAKIPNATDLLFDQIIQIRRKPPGFPIIHFDASDILLAAPDHFLFLFALALGFDRRSGDDGSDEH